jgi:hypothetical protein
MDNSSFEVVTTTDKITIESGGFRMFGNKPSTLSRTNFDASTQIQLHPNPTSKYFTLNTNVNKVQIFSVTGQLVKTFAKNLKDNQFEIGELIKGIYLVKVTDENNSTKSFKLIKQ